MVNKTISGARTRAENEADIHLQTFRRNHARSWIFRKIWGKYFLDLTDADAGRLIKLICRYERGQLVDPEDLKTSDAVITAQIILDTLDDADRAFAEKMGYNLETGNNHNEAA